MSLENAKEFLKEFRGNSVFRASMENAKDDESRQQLARNAGYDFTREEVTKVMGTDEKISDADLEAVAGGSSAMWITAGATVVGAAAAAGA